MRYTLEDWRALGNTVRLNGHDIFMIDSGGEKPCLLIVHGYPTSSWDFCNQWPALSKRFRVITLDLLGLGFSAKPFPHRYSILDQADLVEAALEHCQAPPCHVLAHDYGDTVAQELLARDQQRTKQQDRQRYLSATFLNGGLFPETHYARPMQKLMAGPLGPLLIKLTTREKLLKTFCSVFGSDSQPSQQELDAVWQLVRENRGLRCLPPLLGYIRERRQYRERWVDALSHAAIPLALINGGADPVSGAHMVERFRELVGKQHFIHEMPTIGHYPQMEAPEETLQAFLRFIDGLTSDAENRHPDAAKASHG